MDSRNWRFFLTIEADLAATERYVEFSDGNMQTYSIEYARLFLATCSEVDVVAKLLCRCIDRQEKPGKINEYRKLILRQYPRFPSMEVLLPSHGIQRSPWSGWKSKSPSWWKSYNDVKHTRHEQFKKASLENVIDAVAGLFCLELYLYGYHPRFRREDLAPWPALLTIKEEPPGCIGLEGEFGLPDDPDNGE